MPNSIDLTSENYKKLIEPIVFFDQFDYPLTAYEIFYYLDKSFDLSLINEELEKAQHLKVINQQNGFFFLAGRDEVVQIRQKRYNYFCAKLKIAKRFCRLFSYIPFVKGVAIVNLLGAHNLKQDGDIDLFIITERGRVWLSRFFCTGLAKILNKRPTKTKKKDRICLSFYVAEDYLDLSNLVLDGQQPYWYYYLRGFMPLYDKHKTFLRFLTANHLEVGDESINLPEIKADKNILLQKLELVVKKIQLKIMPSDLRFAMNNSEGVFVTEGALKFHLNDKRRYFSENLKNKLNEIFSKVN